MSRIKTAVPLALVVLLSASLIWALFFWQGQSQSEPPPLAPLPQGGGFELQSSQGPVTLRDFRGKIVLVYFGYSLCPDICPTNLAYLAEALNMLSTEERAQIQGIFVSLDPERDTPENLLRYVKFFHPDFIGLTSTPEILAELAQRYGVGYQKVAMGDSALNYVLDHSSYTYIIDRHGVLQGRFEHATSPAEMAQYLQKLLRQRLT